MRKRHRASPQKVRRRLRLNWYTRAMQLYSPPTKIEGRWRDGVVIAIGVWLTMLGGFAWWTDYLLYSVPEFVEEWTAEEREESLSHLVERAQQQGVIEATAEEKMKALQQFQ